MTEFIDAALSFPTVVLTIMLVVSVVYWVAAIVGGGLEMGTGGGGGGSDLLDGLAGGGGGGDGMLDMFDGQGGGGGDGALDTGGGRGPVGTVLESLGIGTVPTAIVLSLLVLFAWFFSLVGNSFVDSLALSATAGLLATLAVMLVAAVLAVLLTMVSTRPVARLFVHTEAQARSSLIGRTCVVQTQRVDSGFGQAEVTDPEGATLLVQVRTQAGNELHRGDTGLLVTYDDDLDAFIVAPADDVITNPFS